MDKQAWEAEWPCPVPVDMNSLRNISAKGVSFANVVELKNRIKDDFKSLRMLT